MTEHPEKFRSALPPRPGFDFPPVDGGHKTRSLSHYLSTAPAPLGFIIPKFVSVIDAIEEAHAKKRKHRSLSPKTIRFTAQGRAEVPTAQVRPAGSTVVFGSPKYATPESLEQIEEPADCLAQDAYVLGFIFYEILLGRELFESEFHEICKQGEFAWMIWHADKERSAKPLHELIDGFPRALSMLVAGMMAKDSATRTRDLKTVRNMLTGALQVTRVYSGSVPDALFAAREDEKVDLRSIVSEFSKHVNRLGSGVTNALRRPIASGLAQSVRIGVRNLIRQAKRGHARIKRSLNLRFMRLRKECDLWTN